MRFDDFFDLGCACLCMLTQIDAFLLFILLSPLSYSRIFEYQCVLFLSGCIVRNLTGGHEPYSFPGGWAILFIVFVNGLLCVVL